MEEHKQWVSEVFDRAAPHYGKKHSSFFNYFGKRLVDLVEVESHHQVLDVATGRGAILFPLADAIGSEGRVTGIDISEQMLHQTAMELVQKGVDSIELLHMDAENLDFPENTFDLVCCGFALLFFPSALRALAECKRVLKPGGSLAISVWGKGSDLDHCINQVIKAPGLAITPVWDEEKLRTILEETHFHNIQICEEKKVFTYETAEDWWKSLWSHGARARFEQLSPQELEAVRQSVLNRATNLAKERRIEEEHQVFYGRATK